MPIRPANTADHPALLDVWLRSVRATHTFLSEDDISQLLPLVRDHALTKLELWVLTDESNQPLGFMGLDDNHLEALFLDPDHLRRGGGRRLVQHARMLKGPLTVDVNEQNPDALRFYEALGFLIAGRSDLDDAGRPFPIIHLRDPGAQP